MYQLILLLIAVFLYFGHAVIVRVPYEIQQVIFLSTTLLLGVPHGATDLLVARNTALVRRRSFSLFLFFAEYLGLIVIFVLLFYFFPLIAILIFIFLAAYHFGESDLPKHNISSYAAVGFRCLYGLFIIAVIILPHWDEARSLISLIASGNRQQFILDLIQKNRFIILSVLSSCMLISSIFYLFIVPSTNRERLEFLICTAGITLILWQLPMLLGFTAYFVFWHSLRSLHQIVTYLLMGKSVPLPRIVGEMVFYSSMAILGVGLLGIISYGFADVKSMQLYIFFGLAILTAPHMYIMHQMQINTSGADTHSPLH